MKIKIFIKKNYLFLIILLFAFLVRLIYFFDLHEIWWDSGTYVAMGKYIFSAGNTGLWENMRPPLLPIFLGLLWKLKLNILIAGRIFELILAALSVFFVYIITKKRFNEKTALFASVLFAFSSIFFFMTFHLYNEILAICLILLGIYLLIIHQHFFAGFAVSLAFLSKFPAGIFILALIIPLLLKKKLKNTAIIMAGFAIPAGIYLIINYFVYGNAFLPFITAQNTIKLVLGCNVFNYKPWWQYFIWILYENPLHVLAIPGIILYFKSKKRNLVLGLSLFLPLAYFAQLHCRDYRYLILFIPFVCIFTAIGLNYFNEMFKKHKKQIFIFIFIAVFIISIFNCIQYYQKNTPRYISPAQDNYFKFFKNKLPKNEIWATNPIHAVFADIKINKAYDPLFADYNLTTLLSNVKSNLENISYVLIDNCGGGFMCEKADEICEKRLSETELFLDKNFEKVYDEKHAHCYYKIYKSTFLS